MPLQRLAPGIQFLVGTQCIASCRGSTNRLLWSRHIPRLSVFLGEILSRFKFPTSEDVFRLKASILNRIKTHFRHLSTPRLQRGAKQEVAEQLRVPNKTAGMLTEEV